MAIQKYVGISGYKYAPKPKMGTSNIFYGVPLDANGEKKISRKFKKEKTKMEGKQKMAKTKKAKSSSKDSKLDSNFMYSMMSDSSASKSYKKTKKK